LKERRRVVPYLKVEVSAGDIFGFRVVEGDENFHHARFSLLVSSKQAFAIFTTFCNCFNEYSKGNTSSKKKISQIARTWTCLLLICSNRYLPPPKLFGGLPTAMVLLPRTENDDAT